MVSMQAPAKKQRHDTLKRAMVLENPSPSALVKRQSFAEQREILSRRLANESDQVFKAMMTGLLPLVEEAAQLEEKLAKSEKSMEGLLKEHEKMMEELGNEHENKIADLRKEHEKKLEELRTDQTARFVDFWKAADIRIAEARDEGRRQALSLHNAAPAIGAKTKIEN